MEHTLFFKFLQFWLCFACTCTGTIWQLFHLAMSSRIINFCKTSLHFHILFNLIMMFKVSHKITIVIRILKLCEHIWWKKLMYIFVWKKNTIISWLSIAFFVFFFLLLLFALFLGSSNHHDGSSRPQTPLRQEPTEVAKVHWGGSP